MFYWMCSMYYKYGLFSLSRRILS